MHIRMSAGGPDLKGKMWDRGDVDLRTSRTTWTPRILNADVEHNADNKDNTRRNEHVGIGVILSGNLQWEILDPWRPRWCLVL